MVVKFPYEVNLMTNLQCTASTLLIYLRQNSSYAYTDFPSEILPPPFQKCALGAHHKQWLVESLQYVLLNIFSLLRGHYCQCFRKYVARRPFYQFARGHTVCRALV